MYMHTFFFYAGDSQLYTLFSVLLCSLIFTYQFFLEILPHHFNGALAGLIRDLATFAIRRRDGCAAGERKPERLGKRIHG